MTIGSIQYLDTIKQEEQNTIKHWPENYPELINDERTRREVLFESGEGLKCCKKVRRRRREIEHNLI